MRDANVPAFRFYGFERGVPEVAEQLKQRRCLETFTVATAQHGIAAVGRIGTAGSEGRVVAVGFMIVVAHAASQREPLVGG